MTITKGYDGSVHASTSKRASEVKVRGHKKEEVLANRLGYSVVKGTQKHDIVSIDGRDRISVKGASTNIQLYLSSLNKSSIVYGKDSPMYQYQLAGYDHRKFKYENDNFVDDDLFDFFIESANDVVDWLKDKDNFRMVIEKVFSDSYDANKLAVMLEVDSPAYIYNMKEVVDLYVNSNYKVNVTDGGKIVVRVGKYEIFYLEIRGGKNHCGSMNHGVRSILYKFLSENLDSTIIGA